MQSIEWHILSAMDSYLQAHIAVIGKVNTKQRAAKHCAVQELNKLVSTLEQTLRTTSALRCLQTITHRNQHARSEINLLRVLESRAASLVHNFQVKTIKYLPLINIICSVGSIRSLCTGSRIVSISRRMGLRV
jgi:hypothetical protein